MVRTKQRVARFTFQGPDRKGLIGRITTFFFQNDGNILDIDQRILENYLVMNTVVDLSDLKRPWEIFLRDLTEVARSVGMALTIDDLARTADKNIALLVTTETHCAEKIISDVKAGKICGGIQVMIGNQPGLEALARKNKIPFRHVPSDNRRAHETGVLDILLEYKTDLVVLARYMQILSPEFVFRYEGRIINIHPSLLPAFPGPRGYHQAFNKGVDYVGVTAHFVTTDLDEGPVICQEAMRVDRTKESVEDYIRRGRVLEAKALAKAVQLFCADKLSLRRGKVTIGAKESRLAKVTKGFYKG